jgi:hypothetical protein
MTTTVKDPLEPVASPEGASQPGWARAMRATRLAIDAGTVAWFLYLVTTGAEGLNRLFFLWMLSVPAIPYASMTNTKPWRRAFVWPFFALGIFILGAGLLRDLAPVRAVLHGTPTNDGMVWGSIIALLSLTSLLDPRNSPSLRRLLLGTAVLVVGAVWVWLSPTW